MEESSGAVDWRAVRPILCLRNEPSDTLGIAADALRGAGAEVVVQNAWGLGSWPDPREFSALAAFGGSMNADQVEQHPHLLEERTFLRRSLDVGVPTLAVCLGAQVLARALGTEVVRAPARELGFYRIQATGPGSRDEVLAPFVPDQLTFQWHEDTFELPPGATLLATGEDGGVQAYRAGAALAVQFHPEVTADEVEAWFDEVGDDRLRQAWGKSRQDLHEEIATHMAGHNERGRELFRRFARAVRSQLAPA